METPSPWPTTCNHVSLVAIVAAAAYGGGHCNIHVYDSCETKPEVSEIFRGDTWREYIAAQHIVMIMEYRIRQDKRRKLCDRQIIWRKIRKREGTDAYTTALFEKLESSDGQIGGKDIERILISTT